MNDSHQDKDLSAEKNEMNHLKNPVKSLLQMGGLQLERERQGDIHSEPSDSRPNTTTVYDNYQRRKTANWDSKLNVINEDE